MYHGFCNRGGCHVDAKNRPDVTTIPRAQKTGRLKVVTEAHVTKIESSDAGRVTGVTYVTGKEEFFQPAKVVLLSSYTYENARLLLLSTSKAFPKGLSNNHGQVGRHYMSHATGASVTALFPFNLNTLVRPAGAGRGGRRLGRRQLRSRRARLHRRRQPVGVLGPAADRRGQHDHLRPHAGLGRGVEGVREGERRSHQHRVPAEDDAALRGQLPRPRSGGEGSARLPGAAASPPTTRTTSGRSPRSSRTRWSCGTARPAPSTSSAARSARWASTRTPTAARAWATTPRPTSSNRWGFSHEVPNLGVLGASVMGTSGAHNPTLTVQALAWRTAEHLVKNWKTIAE